MIFLKILKRIWKVLTTHPSPPTHTKCKLWERMHVLTNIIVALTLQYIKISDHHVDTLKLLYVICELYFNKPRQNQNEKFNSFFLLAVIVSTEKYAITLFILLKKILTFPLATLKSLSFLCSLVLYDLLMCDFSCISSDLGPL